MKHIQPPNQVPQGDKKVFLAGTIDMGDSHDWQAEVATMFEDMDITVVNPRREDWDSSWVQEYENPHFYQQVNWELENLRRADFIIFYFAPDSKSPITLLEMGRFGNAWNTVVVCPKGYYRKGNVDIFCSNEAIKQADSLEEAVEMAKKHFNSQL